MPIDLAVEISKADKLFCIIVICVKARSLKGMLLRKIGEKDVGRILHTGFNGDNGPFLFGSGLRLCCLLLRSGIGCRGALAGQSQADEFLPAHGADLVDGIKGKDPG